MILPVIVAVIRRSTTYTEQEEMIHVWVKREKFEKSCLKIRITITLAAVITALVSLSAVAARLVPEALAEDDAIKLPVLMYHAIISDTRKSGDYVITPASFRKDMEYIRDSGYNTVVMEDIILYVKNGAPLPENPIMITIDDGYYSCYLYAYPILKELNMRAVFSIIGIEADKYSASPDTHENYAHCTWDQLREMQDSGVIELQSHSYDMHHITNDYMGIGRSNGMELVAYKTKLYTDLSKMQNRFKEKLGITPSTFAYPFGAAPKDSTSVLRDLGFEATLGVGELTYYVTRSEKCLQYIPRYNRTCRRSAESILLNTK